MLSFVANNPEGVRGHTAYFADAVVDIEFVEFRELGRTKAGRLDNTLYNQSGDPRIIGRNQVGRYPVHLHHLHGPEDGVS